MAQDRRISQFLTNKVLGIDVDERYSKQPHDLDRRAKEALNSAEIFLEEEPTVIEWFKEHTPTGRGALHYMRSLFPFASWIRRYNLGWLSGDIVAGITIGMVVVPQAMAYAALAQLTPAYGLYTSFTGAVLYWVFGTSKDIVIGTTAVGSLLVGQVIGRVSAAAPGNYSPEEIAHALGFMIGVVLLFFGLLRLGWIIEFIPYIPISAFVTAASITIISTQIPTVLGIPGINTREAPYQVMINTLKGLPNVRLDAAIGLSSITLLFAIRGFCTMMEERRPAQKRMWSFISSLRLTFIMMLFTIISYIVHRNTPLEDAKFRIVGDVERGFRRVGSPRLSSDLLGHILPELPAVAIILVIEHIAIAKAMGRMYNYTINPSQEIVALGAANLLSPFIGGYVCTGSFGASAVLSKAGVRTPLAGLFSAVVLVLSLYALTGVFYYIPKAALAGLIIHAVYNLLNPPQNLLRYWQLSPLELFIWVVGVSLAIFYSLEWSIYVGIILSVIVLLYRLARTRGRFLGLVRVKRTVRERSQSDGDLGASTFIKNQSSTRVVFLPIDRQDSSNPCIKVESPYPGVFVYRFSEGYNYTNQACHVDTLFKYVMQHTRRMTEEHYERDSDRLWNDAGPRIYKCSNPEELPFLRAIVLDFAAVNNVDITSVQGLIDLRNTFDQHSAPDTVEWHFANVNNRWARRALAVAGFGYPTSQNPEALSHWKPLYSIAPADSKIQGVSVKERRRSMDTERNAERASGQKWPRATESTVEAADRSSIDTKINVDTSSGESTPVGRMASVSPVDRPFFHMDLHEAVESAVMDARAKDMAI